MVWIDNLYFNQEMKTVIQNIISNELVNVFSSKKNFKENELPFAKLPYKKKVREIDGSISAIFLNKKKSKLIQNCFLQIISYCKQNDIQLIALKFPITKIYYDKIKKMGFFPKELMIKNNIEFYDYTDIYFDNDSLFYNHNHLNELGAKKFNEILKVDFFSN